MPNKNPYGKHQEKLIILENSGSIFLKLYIAGNDNKTQLNLSLSQLSHHFSIDFIFHFVVASDHRLQTTMTNFSAIGLSIFYDSVLS